MTTHLSKNTHHGPLIGTVYSVKYNRTNNIIIYTLLINFYKKLT
jgi:hypothetical protein